MPKIALNNVNMVENMAKIFGQYGHFGQNQPFLAVIGRVISVVYIECLYESTTSIFTYHVCLNVKLK